MVVYLSHKLMINYLWFLFTLQVQYVTDSDHFVHCCRGLPNKFPVFPPGGGRLFGGIPPGGIPGLFPCGGIPPGGIPPGPPGPPGLIPPGGIPPGGIPPGGIFPIG